MHYLLYHLGKTGQRNQLVVWFGQIAPRVSFYYLVPEMIRI